MNPTSPSRTAATDVGDGSGQTTGDFKSALQEQLHEMGRPEPIYQVVDEIGPDHRKVFVVEVVVGDEVVARSSGRTKKEAQQEAARKALEGLKDTGPGNENQATSEGDSS